MCLDISFVQRDLSRYPVTLLNHAADCRYISHRASGPVALCVSFICHAHVYYVCVCRYTYIFVCVYVCVSTQGDGRTYANLPSHMAADGGAGQPTNLASASIKDLRRPYRLFLTAFAFALSWLYLS